MATWTTPKTNWKNGDYFNVNPDYNRIKGNIEWLTDFAETLYGSFEAPTLDTMTTASIPYVDFFNNIVEATSAILDNCLSPQGARPMRLYSANGLGFSAEELNAIETNHLLLYQALPEVRNGLTKLSFTLGGTRWR